MSSGHKELIYPLIYTDIESETETRYWVESPDTVEKMEDRRLLRHLKEIESALYQDIHIIAEPERFDFCYFFIKLLGKKQDTVNLECVKTCADLLQAGLSRIIEEIDDAIDNSEQISASDLKIKRNTFKMWLFLNQFFLNLTCVRKSKNSIEDQLQNAMLGGDGNKKKGKGNKRKDLSNDYVDILLEKQKGIIDTLFDVITIDLNFLWQGKPIDQEFYRYLAEIAVKMLESRQLLKKYESVKQQVFTILESVFKIQPETSRNVQAKIIHLVYEDEQLVDNVVDFVCKAQSSTDANLQNLTAETVILITNYANQQKQNLNTESQSIKNTKQFLVKIAEKFPKIFNTNLSVFIKLYDNEAYHLRNAINEIIGRIIKNVLTVRDDDDNEEEQSENHIKQKNKLFETLIKRIYDKHAYCRSNILAVLSELCEANTVPQAYLFPLLSCGCDRIKDQSGNVRKKAVQLIVNVMKIYFHIYVENNKDSSVKGFSSIDVLKRDIKSLQMDQKEYQQDSKIIEEQLEAITGATPEEEELFDDLKEKKTMLKRKMEYTQSVEQKIQEYLNILETVEAIIPNLTSLLGSKNINDVTETIRLFVYLYKCQIKSANQGIKKMLVLVWSREKSIKEELVRAYWALFLNDKEFKRQQVAMNIIKIFQGANLSEITSLEELLQFIINWNNNLDDKDKEKKQNLYYIHSEVFQHIWTYFKQLLEKRIEQEGDDEEGVDEESIQKMRSSLSILRICIPYKKQVFNSDKLISLTEVLKGFLKNNKPDWVIVKEIANITCTVKDMKQDYKQMFVKLLIFILIKFQGTQDNEWYIASESILNMIFIVQPNPEQLCQFFLLKLTKNLVSQEDQQQYQMNTQNEFPQAYPQTQTPTKKQSQDLNIMEQRTLLKTPTNFVDENNESVNGEEQVNTKGINFERKLSHLLFVVGHSALKLILLVDQIESQLKKLKIEGENRQDKKNEQNQDEENNELDKVYGGLEAEFEKEKEKLHNLAEKTIIQGDNLLSQYRPWIMKIVNDMLNSENLNVRNSDLDRVAVLGMCKFMCASQEFSKQNLKTLFQILQSNADEIIKTNVIVSLGDLLHKYQNLLTPFIDKVYENLHDKNLQVRKTTMMVLTHLILNDMMKIKGEICEVALLLEDENDNVSGLVKLFLHELHKKDPKLIYNMLPEAIGRMSNQDKTKLGASITEESFTTFAKNIMPYLEKGSETLIEKLLNRLETKNQREQINVSYCLSQLTYNDKGIRLLLDHFEKYRLLLQNEQIMQNFQNILSKLKKFSKPEVKNMIDEWEDKLSDHTTETFDSRRIENKKKKKAVKKKRGGAKKDSEDESSDDNEQSVKKSKKKRGTQSKSKNKKKNRMTLEEDDEEDSFVDDDSSESIGDSEDSQSSSKNKKKGNSTQSNSKRGLRNKGQQKKRMTEIQEENESDQEEEISKPTVNRRKRGVRMEEDDE